MAQQQFDFIKDPTVLEIITSILEAAGPNFNAPYDFGSQPSDANARNEEELTKYEVPGGTELKSTANPAASPSMGFVISSVLSILSPFMSAYSMLLPILGIIKAIIEVLCCLMNPFCVVDALVRLFKKWIPAFVSLFPASAGILLLLLIIKLIMALIFFILTEIVPTIQLIIKNIEEGVKAIEERNLLKAEAIKQKISSIITDLANRLGIIKVAKPILDIIFAILQLVIGWPCEDEEENTKCCNPTQCPPAIKNPPHGQGLLIPIPYADSLPLLAWRLIIVTGGENIPKLKPYFQNFASQLNPQLDKAISVARPAGSLQLDSAFFRLRIMGRRGETFCVTNATSSVPVGSIVVPIADIDDYDNLILTNVFLPKFAGLVDYCIEPDYHNLIAQSIIGVGCHPDVENAKRELKNRFNLDKPVFQKYPELSGIPDRYAKLISDIDAFLKRLSNYAQNPNDVQNVQDEMVAMLFGEIDYYTNGLNILLSRAADNMMSELDVDKNVAKADGVDKAIVSVTPKDITGAFLGKNLPSDTDINVTIFTDFGTLKNQKRNNATGVITAELQSLFAGEATIMAKINDKFLVDVNGVVETIRTRKVRFISDTVMPKRRLTTRPSPQSSMLTDSSPNKRPGGK